MVFFTIFAGIGIGGEYGVGQTLVTETVSARWRGAWSSMLYSGAFIGILLAAAGGGLVVPYVGWSWSLIIASVPVILVVLIRLTAPESALWESRKASGRHVAAGREFAQPAFLKPLLLCYATATLQLFAYYGITTLMPTYLVNVAGFSLTKASWWIFFTGVAGLCGAIIAALTIDRIGRRLALSMAAVVGAIGGVLVFGLWAQLKSLSEILIPFFLLYAGFGATASVFGSLFSEVFPVSMRGTGITSALQLARGTTFAAPLIASALFPVIGYPPLIMGAVVLLVLLALAAWLFPETTGASVDY
jgi:putative MFS transporter